MKTPDKQALPDLYGAEPLVRYDGIGSSSLYLTMRDGTKIAVDVMLPANRSPERPLPALMIMARYWRSMALRFPDQPNKALIGPREPIADYLIPRGFAVVVVDGRGSGASTGVSRHPWSPEELSDYAEVTAWVAEQPWCNGNIGAFGISYEGATALRLASTGVSALKAVAPQEIEFDVYTDVALPGGIFNDAFMRAWNESNNKLDSGKPSSLFPWSARLFVKGIRPVDSDRETRAVLTKALQDHLANTDVYQSMKRIIYRDDPFGDTGITLDDFSVFIHRQAIEQSQVAIFNWGSWLDGTAAESALRTHNTFNNPQITVIGAWKHEMTAHGSPYQKPKAKPNPKKEEQWAALAQFFGHTVEQGQPAEGKSIYYYTLGAESWKYTDVFPLPNTDMQAWYFQADQVLAPEKPTVDAGLDSYTVDFAATTGKTNRWHTPMARPVIYHDRKREDRRLLTYTSVPLQQDLEVTGYPVVTLYLSSSEEDGAFIVYLEDVDEDGVVRYITEGQLRGIHRKLASAPAPYWTGMPYRTFKRAEAAPLPRGEIVELVFGLQPTSVLFRRGHSIRVAVAGADKNTFSRIPAQGRPTWQVSRSTSQASHVQLPVIR
jgi:putative CocE/NonD family hydrolase